MERVTEGVTVYFDLDNVLAKFSTRENEAEQLKRMFDKGFYLSLEVMDGADEVLRELQGKGIKYKIISGLIESPYVKDEKIEWCKQMLGVNSDDVILIPMNGSKAEKIGRLLKWDILVDDWYRYVDEWVANGGTGILYVRKCEVDGYRCAKSMKDVLRLILEIRDELIAK